MSGFGNELSKILRAGQRENERNRKMYRKEEQERDVRKIYARKKEGKLIDRKRKKKGERLFLGIKFIDYL